MKQLLNLRQYQGCEIPIRIVEIENHTRTKIRGVIHIGASYGEETNEYRANNVENVVWVEPLEYGFSQLKLLEQTYGDRIFNCAIGNIDGETEFFVTNNFVSSSIRNLGTHAVVAPDVVVSQKCKVKTFRLDTLIEQNNIDMSLYNMLNVDTQGTEDLVLEGCEKNLKYFDALCIETNDENAYVGCKGRQQIEKYLIERGFIPRIVKKVHPVQYEELYVRKELI